jgi:hypothetical protein
MKLFFVSHRFRRLNYPGALLLALLQRTPVLRVAADAEAALIASPVANVLRSVLTAVASLGAIQSMAGATPLVPSSGTATGVTVTTGTAVSIAYTVTGTDTKPQSWKVTGSFAPGLDFSGLTADGTVNVQNLKLSGTPTTAGSYLVHIIAYEGTNGTLIASPTYDYTVTVNAATVTAPSFTTQPQSQTVTSGASVTFSAAASGSPTYQWNKDNVAISGATSSSYTISNVQPTNAGSYTVVATNSGGSTTSNAATLTVNVAPTITTQPASQTVAAGGSVTFTGAASGTPTPTYQWQKGGANITGATSATLTLNNVQSSDAGTYTLVATNSAASATSNAATLTVTAAGTAPAFTTQPSPQIVTVGSNVTLTAAVIASPAATYQWNKDGVAVSNGGRVSGATSAAMTITGATAADTGNYTLVATNTAGATTSTGAMLTVNAVPASVSSAWLTNLSVRTTIVTGQNPLTVGLYVQGGAKNILVRNSGPALAALGLSGTMVDPQLLLFQQGGSTTVPIFTNDDWDPALGPTFASVGAFGFPAGSKDAAFVKSLDGGYTVQVPTTGPGTVLVEAYDMTSSANSPRMVNISARNRVGVGNDVLIEGFNISGSGTKKLLVRAVGPTLASFGVSGTLADPKLELYDSNNVKLAENDNWDASLAPTFNAVGAFGLIPGSKDAAMIVTLSAGKSFTVLARGADGGTGEAIVEVYEVP